MGSNHRSERHRERLLMGGAAIVSLEEAAHRLPLDDRDARRWLVDAGCVRLLAGRKTVLWERVLEAWDGLPLYDGARASTGLHAVPAAEHLPRVELGRRARRRCDGGSGPSRNGR